MNDKLNQSRALNTSVSTAADPNRSWMVTSHLLSQIDKSSHMKGIVEAYDEIKKNRSSLENNIQSALLAIRQVMEQNKGDLLILNPTSASSQAAAHLFQISKINDQIVKCEDNIFKQFTEFSTKAKRATASHVKFYEAHHKALTRDNQSLKFRLKMMNNASQLNFEGTLLCHYQEKIEFLQAVVNHKETIIRQLRSKMASSKMNNFYKKMDDMFRRPRQGLGLNIPEREADSGGDGQTLHPQAMDSLSQNIKNYSVDHHFGDVAIDPIGVSNNPSSDSMIAPTNQAIPNDQSSKKFSKTKEFLQEVLHDVQALELKKLGLKEQLSACEEQLHRQLPNSPKTAVPIPAPQQPLADKIAKIKAELGDLDQELDMKKQDLKQLEKECDQLQTILSKRLRTMVSDQKFSQAKNGGAHNPQTFKNKLSKFGLEKDLQNDDLHAEIQYLLSSKVMLRNLNGRVRKMQQSEPIWKRYKLLNFDPSRFLAKTETAADPGNNGETDRSDVQKGLETMAMNSEMMAKASAMLDYAMEENQNLIDENQRIQLRLIKQERELDAEKARLLELTGENQLQSHQLVLNEAELAERARLIRTQKEKIEKLRQIKKNLQAENEELKAKIKDNEQQIKSSLEQIQKLMKENARIQAEFDRENKKMFGLVQESVELKKTLDLLRLDNDVMQKRISTFELREKNQESKINFLKGQLAQNEAMRVQIMTELDKYMNKKLLPQKLTLPTKLLEDRPGFQSALLSIKYREALIQTGELKHQTATLEAQLRSEWNRNKELVAKLDSYEKNERVFLKEKIQRLKEELATFKNASGHDKPRSSLRSNEYNPIRQNRVNSGNSLKGEGKQRLSHHQEAYGVPGEFMDGQGVRGHE